MNKHETSFSIRFRHWLLANPMMINCWFELKDTRGVKSFPLREWKEDQREFARALSESDKGVLIRTDGIPGLPDYKYSYREPTFVVIKYPEGFVIIAWENLIVQKTKSLSWDSAKEIAVKVVKL